MRGKKKGGGISPSDVSSLALPIIKDRLAHCGMRLFCVCAALYIVGVIIGAALFSGGGELLRNYFGYLLSGSITARTASKLVVSILYTFLPHAAALLLCCVFSYCTVGAPFILLLLTFSGAGVGLMGAFVCDALGWTGIFFNLIVLAPASAIAVLGLINLAIKGLRASSALYYIAYRGRSRRLSGLNDEIYHALALAAAAAFLSSVLQGVLFKLLGSSLLSVTI